MDDKLDEKLELPKVTEDIAVDVTEFKRNGEGRVTAKEDPDETECSSSFADTISGSESHTGMSDAEVESQLQGGASAFDGFSSLFPLRKKKLTRHWRSFIRPIMWRCKWAELKMKQLESQAAKYSQELAAHEQKKHEAIDQTVVEESGSRSLPYPFQTICQKPKKRRKRKKLEDLTDTTSYMSNHYLFSYQERKKNDVGGADDFSNPVSKEQNGSGIDDSEYIDFLEDNNNIVEESLRKIELTQSRVHRMKAQLDLIMNKNACKLSSSESLSLLVPRDANTISVPSPTFSVCNGDAMPVQGLCSPMLMPECDFEDFMMPESGASSYGEAMLVPDVIESTAGLLSSAKVTQHQRPVGDSWEKIVDNILPQKESGDVVGQTSRMVKNQSAEKLPDADHSGEDESHPAASESDAVRRTAIHRDESSLRSGLASGIHFPKNKRKRGERKAASGGWSRHLDG